MDMREFDLKRLENAITYIERMALGLNPVNNLPVEESSVLNNPNVIRCMFYVGDVLKAVYDNGGSTAATTSKNRSQTMFPTEVVEMFTYREDKGISKLIDQIFEPVKNRGYRKLTGKQVNEKLQKAGFIREVYNEELKKNVKEPTEKGISLGLRLEWKDYRGSRYPVIFYDRRAQEYLIKNLQRIWDKEELG